MPAESEPQPSVVVRDDTLEVIRSSDPTLVSPSEPTWDDESEPEKVCSPPIPRAALERRIRETTRRDVQKVWRDRVRTLAWWLWPLLVFATGIAVVVRSQHQLQSQYAPFTAAFATIVAAGVAALVAFRVSMYSPARLKKLEVQLAYVERQLTDLWGPLYGEINMSQYYYHDLLDRLLTLDAKNPMPRLNATEISAWPEGTRDHEDETHALRRGERAKNGVAVQRAKNSLDPFYELDLWDSRQLWRTWDKFSRTYALARNADVAKLLTDNYSLIGQDHIPDIQRYLAHEAEYRSTYERVSKLIDTERWDTWSRQVRSHKEQFKLQNRYPEALEYHVYHKVRFLLYLQKKYRSLIDGAKFKVVLSSTRRGARHRELSRSRPANEVNELPEAWAREVEFKLLHHKLMHRSTRDLLIDLAWLLAEAATGATYTARSRSAEPETPLATTKNLERTLRLLVEAAEDDDPLTQFADRPTLEGQAARRRSRFENVQTFRTSRAAFVGRFLPSRRRNVLDGKQRNKGLTWFISTGLLERRDTTSAPDDASGYWLVRPSWHGASRASGPDLTTIPPETAAE